AGDRPMPMYLLDRFPRECSALADSLNIHLSQQEGHLFPMIRHVCRSVEEAGWACHLDDPVENLMDEATREGREAVASVKRAEDCLYGVNCQGALVSELAKGLRELRQDLEEHVQLEADVLFPAVRELLQGDNQAMERLLEEGSLSRMDIPVRPARRRTGMSILPAGQPKGRSVHAAAFYRWLDPVMEEMGYRDRQRACRA